jgi:hypothetical protein
VISAPSPFRRTPSVYLGPYSFAHPRLIRIVLTMLTLRASRCARIQTPFRVVLEQVLARMQLFWLGLCAAKIRQYGLNTRLLWTNFLLKTVGLDDYPIRSLGDNAAMGDT